MNPKTRNIVDKIVTRNRQPPMSNYIVYPYCVVGDDELLNEAPEGAPEGINVEPGVSVPRRGRGTARVMKEFVFSVYFRRLGVVHYLQWLSAERTGNVLRCTTIESAMEVSVSSDFQFAAT